MRGPLYHHFVNQTELLGLGRIEKLVAVPVGDDDREILTGMFGVDLVETVAPFEDLGRLDLDVGGRAAESRRAAGAS